MLSTTGIDSRSQTSRKSFFNRWVSRPTCWSKAAYIPSSDLRDMRNTSCGMIDCGLTLMWSTRS